METKEKLTREQIIPYLNSGLMGIFFHQTDIVIGYNFEHDLISGLNSGAILLHDFKPILKPLSDLTKTQEHIDEFFIMYGGGFKSKKDFLSTGFIDGIINSSYQAYTYSLISKLLELNYDVFRLIPNGLAIDINTIKIDYK